MAQPSQPDFQKKPSPAPVAAPSQAMAPRPFAPQVDVATPDVQAPDVAAPDALTLDSAPAFPKLNFHIRTAGGSPPPIQPKLTIGAPNDKYEQEADRVAAQVVQRIHLPAANLSTEHRAYPSQSVQRQAWPEQPVLQMKSTLQRETLPDEDDELQMKPMLQRLEMPEDDELQMKPMPQRSDMPPGVKLQMRSAFSEGVVEGDASPDLETGIQRARGNGQALAPTLQMHMGQAMGADFSGVRIHTDAQSDQLNRSIQAKAFTTGQDIFFRQGAYQPGSQSGQELIAHELTHVMQQDGGLRRGAERHRHPMGGTEGRMGDSGDRGGWVEMAGGTTGKGSDVLQRISTQDSSHQVDTQGRASRSSYFFGLDGKILGNDANWTNWVTAGLYDRDQFRSDYGIRDGNEPFAMHLVNAKLGGEGGTPGNLAWGLSALNRQHNQAFEEPMKEIAADPQNSGGTLEIEVRAQYFSPVPNNPAMAHTLYALNCFYSLRDSDGDLVDEDSIMVDSNVGPEGADTEYVDDAGMELDNDHVIDEDDNYMDDDDD